MEEIIVRMRARHKGLVKAVKALVEHVSAFDCRFDGFEPCCNLRPRSHAAEDTRALSASRRSTRQLSPNSWVR